MPRRWGRIPAAVAHSGLGRSSLYELAARYPGIFKKYGAVTLVDFKFLDRVLAKLPAAEISVKRAVKETT
jgi:hypothetical protein